MRRWLTLILTTLAATAVAVAAAVGVDYVWQAAPGSTPVAAVLGDQRIDLDSEVPPSPAEVGVYEVTGPLTKADLREILPGRIEKQDGWLVWWGDSDVPVRQVLRRLYPGIQWRVQDGVFGPAIPGQPAITSGGMSPGFTGTDAFAASFGRYLKDDDGQLFYLSLPAVRIAKVHDVEVITAEQALDQLLHHGPAARVLPSDVTLLTSRLAGQSAETLPPVTQIRLIHAQDPASVTRSKPVWVFDPVGEVDAQR